MKRLRSLGLLLLLATVAATSASAAEHEEEGPEAAALAAARAWLEGIDAGEYGESWDEACEYFRGAVTRETWESTLDGVREPLGETTSREVRSKQHTTSLPGAPDGEYVVLQFDAVFEHKAAAIETVTMMREEDGAWRTAGYFIK